MNYKDLYYKFALIFKNQIIPEGTYTEKHHIVPRHAGGTESYDNMLKLTHRQHIFMHRLRWKAYGEIGDKVAYLMMSGYPEAARADWARIAADKRRGIPMKEEVKDKLRAAHKARMEVPEYKLKVVNAALISAANKAKAAEDFSNQLVINSERNEEWLHKKSSRSFYKFVSPEGLVFDSPIYAARYYGQNISNITIENWCKRSKYGWKTIPELAKK